MKSPAGVVDGLAAHFVRLAANVERLLLLHAAHRRHLRRGPSRHLHNGAREARVPPVLHRKHLHHHVAHRRIGRGLQPVAILAVGSLLADHGDLHGRLLGVAVRAALNLVLRPRADNRIENAARLRSQHPSHGPLGAGQAGQCQCQNRSGGDRSWIFHFASLFLKDLPLYPRWRRAKPISSLGSGSVEFYWYAVFPRIPSFPRIRHRYGCPARRHALPRAHPLLANPCEDFPGRPIRVSTSV